MWAARLHQPSSPEWRTSQMKAHLLIAAGLVLTSASLVGVGCSSDSTSGSGGGSGSGTGIFCDEKVSAGGMTLEACVGYTDLPSADDSTVKSECTSAGYKIVSSCPSANSVGTCKFKVGTFNEVETFYKPYTTTTA